MSETSFTVRTDAPHVNPSLLHQELREVLGSLLQTVAVFEDYVEVVLQETATEEELEQIAEIIATHDSKKFSREQIDERRVTEAKRELGNISLATLKSSIEEADDIATLKRGVLQILEQLYLVTSALRLTTLKEE